MNKLGKLEKLSETLPPLKRSEKLISHKNKEQKVISKSNAIQRYFEKMRAGGEGE